MNRILHRIVTRFTLCCRQLTRYILRGLCSPILRQVYPYFRLCYGVNYGNGLKLPESLSANKAKTGKYGEWVISDLTLTTGE